MRRPFVVAGRLRPGRVLYPGSFSHVTASPVFPAAVDVDDDRSARRFCSRLDVVLSFVTRGRGDGLRVDEEKLEAGFKPRRETELTAELLRKLNRGIG